MTTDRSADEQAATGWWRSFTASRVGVIVWSWDFGAGVVIGVTVALSTALSSAVAASMGAVYIGVCGIAAAIATLVITAMTVLIAVIGPNYRLLLQNAPAGLGGILWPYRVVAVTAVLASLSSLCLGILWPLVTGLHWGVVFTLSAVPLVLLSWSLFGCIQVVNQVARHFSNNQRADEIAESVRRASRSA
ncbi:hypothetical protein nbrc107696_18820 [Gordonia spumicola]|uniref:Uncharacterized protein n=1 Tax=Gordonia spumicola TaxID=589161 RepID=A0A7I9V7S2_9ACTN|nr:hypothetical protein [Gordonia spumicola]GEE01436.1 hypothetical protein nbrc107696_18820 [Gordonia spumicola]